MFIRGYHACRTRYDDAIGMLRGSYEETAPVEFSLITVGAHGMPY